MFGIQKAVHKGALLIGMGIFVLVCVTSLDFTTTLSLEHFKVVVIKAFIVSVVCWLMVTIVGDIIIKGVFEDLNKDDLNPLEGGLEQRLHEDKKEKRVKIVDKELIIRGKGK